MRVEKIMKRHVECARPTDSARSIAVKMRDENIGFMPVCDSPTHVIGTITDRDLALRVVAEGKPSSTEIRDLLTPSVVACLASDDTQRAQSLMAENFVSRLVVVDEDGSLVGVVSLSDIAEEEDASETLRQVSEREIHPQ
jgi:CBS domain-containing protein